MFTADEMFCKTSFLYKSYHISLRDISKQYSVIASVLEKANVGSIAEVKVFFL